jgi:hypothetical protein
MPTVRLSLVGSMSAHARSAYCPAVRRLSAIMDRLRGCVNRSAAAEALLAPKPKYSPSMDCSRASFGLSGSPTDAR